MARPQGSYGVIKREVEMDLMRFCDETGFSIGHALGVMLREAFEARDEMAFTRLAVVAERYVTDPPAQADPQRELIPVIDRRRTLEHDAA
jgi:hypothetical protein